MHSLPHRQMLCQLFLLGIVGLSSAVLAELAEQQWRSHQPATVQSVPNQTRPDG